jgi:hypothetical protein
MPGLPNNNPTAGQSSGDFEQFQGFSSKTMQDDFGDFQQSSSMQFPAMPSTRQSEVPRSGQADVFSVASHGDQTRQQLAVNVGHVPVTSSVQQADVGDFHQSLSTQFPAVPSTQQSQVTSSINGMYIYELSLIGMQLPEKYKEHFDVWSEGPSSGVASNSI